MSDCTNGDPKRGSILRRDRLDAIGVLRARDSNWPVRRAPGTGRDERGRQLSRLIVRDVELPGR